MKLSQMEREYFYSSIFGKSPIISLIIQNGSLSKSIIDPALPEAGLLGFVALQSPPLLKVHGTVRIHESGLLRSLGDLCYFI